MLGFNQNTPVMFLLHINISPSEEIIPRWRSLKSNPRQTFSPGRLDWSSGQAKLGQDCLNNVREHIPADGVLLLHWSRESSTRSESVNWEQDSNWRDGCWQRKFYLSENEIHYQCHNTQLSALRTSSPVFTDLNRIYMSSRQWQGSTDWLNALSGVIP